jgi:hypothetical protein
LDKSLKLTSGGLDARRSLSRQCKVPRDRKVFGFGESLRFRAKFTAGIKPAARGYSDRLGAFLDQNKAVGNIDPQMINDALPFGNRFQNLPV